MCGGILSETVHSVKPLDSIVHLTIAIPLSPNRNESPSFRGSPN